MLMSRGVYDALKARRYACAMWGQDYDKVTEHEAEKTTNPPP